MKIANLCGRCRHLVKMGDFGSPSLIHRTCLICGWKSSDTIEDEVIEFVE